MLTEFILVATSHFLAVISPGPDFVLLTRNAMHVSRRAGIYTALGFGIGVAIHSSLALAGVGALVQSSPTLYAALTILGACYLLYIAYSLITSPLRAAHLDLDYTPRYTMSNLSALRMGLTTNISNPKVILYFFSLFTQVVSHATPLWVRILYCAEMTIVTTVWFILLAHLFGHEGFRRRLSHALPYLEKLMGLILVALVLRILIGL